MALNRIDTLIPFVQAAKQIGRSLSWFHANAGKNDVPAKIKIGGRSFISATELDAYIEKCKTERTSRNRDLFKEFTIDKRKV